MEKEFVEGHLVNNLEFILRQEIEKGIDSIEDAACKKKIFDILQIQKINVFKEDCLLQFLEMEMLREHNIEWCEAHAIRYRELRNEGDYSFTHIYVELCKIREVKG